MKEVKTTVSCLIRQRAAALRHFESLSTSISHASSRRPKSGLLRIDIEYLTVKTLLPTCLRVCGSVWIRDCSPTTNIPDADALWRFLQRLISSKITDHMRRESAQKRGGGQVRGESVFINISGERVGSIEGQQANQFSPSELGELAEGQRILLDKLPEDTLREIAMLRLEGFEVKEIAEKLGPSDRSIKRKLAIIREYWQAAVK